MEIEYFTKLRFDDLVNEIKQYIPIRFNSRLKDYIIVDKNILTKTVDNRYSMILAHKLFPNMKKSSENKILINANQRELTLPPNKKNIYLKIRIL